MKQKLLKLKALLVVLMMAVGFGQAFAQDVTYLFSADASNPGNGNDWYSSTIDSYTSWSATQGTTPPRYYDAGTGLRVYNGGTFTVTSTKPIASVTLTFAGASYTFSKTMSNPEVQTPNTTSYEWNVSRTCRLQKVEITYGSDDPSKTPTVTTFNGESSYEVELGEEFVGPTATVSDGTSVIGGASVTYSSTKETVATVDSETGAVVLVGAGTTTIKATYAGDDTYAGSSASYSLTVTKPVPVYASLEELAADENLSDGDIVNVTFENVEIKSVYVSSGNKRTGIYFDIQKGGYDIEIYYSSAEVPSEWVAGGTVSGTMQCPWTKFNNTWELKPNSGTWSWDNLTYQAPAGAKTTATIEFTAKSKLEVGSADEFDVTYNGDGVLEVNSTNEDVATVAIEAGHVVVTAIATGTTVITVSAPETDEYTEASKQYTLTVSPAKQAFDRNVHKALVAEKDGKYFAAYNTIEGSNTYFAVKEVTVYNNKVYNLSDAEAAELAWLINKNSGTATVQNLNNEYLQLTTNKSTVSLSEDEVVLYTKTDGCFYVTETGRGFGYNYNQGNDRMAGYSISAQFPGAKAMEFAEENAPIPANMRISAAGWATFCAPFAVEIPEGVTAYTGTRKQGWIQLNELTDGYIPGGIGTVITGSECQEYLEPMNPQPNSGSLMSCFLPNLTGAIMDVAVGNYLLQIQNDVVGWYKVEGEGFKLAPNRCYLIVPEPNQARPFIGFEPVDDATGISSIATEAKTKADGKYMVNGQIVVVKAGKAYNMNGTEVK